MFYVGRLAYLSVVAALWWQWELHIQYEQSTIGNVMVKTKHLSCPSEPLNWVEPVIILLRMEVLVYLGKVAVAHFGIKKA